MCSKGYFIKSLRLMQLYGRILSGDIMKFMHLADLHIGKRLNEYSLFEDQNYILNEILNIADEEKPDALFIAGDIYDKNQPSAEAIRLFDMFLSRVAERKIKTYIISGNHDCAERVSYGERIFSRQDIFISPIFDGSIAKSVTSDEYGKINIYMLPFVRPIQVKRAYPDKTIETYTDAAEAVIDSLKINNEERNILICHQFVTGAERCDSEDINVGTLDNVDSYVFEIFDYTALGHIHKAQRAGRDNIRYAGSPLKYSASEANHVKSVTVGELREKGNINIRCVPLKPMRDFLDIKGNLEELMNGGNKRDFVRITLTDTSPVVDAFGKLKSKYPFMTEILFSQRQQSAEKTTGVSIEKTAEEQFGEFFEAINGKNMTEEQSELVSAIFKAIKEGEDETDIFDDAGVRPV